MSADSAQSIPLGLRRAHRSAVNGLLWLTTGDYLLSTGNDEKIRLWSLYEPLGRNMLVNFGPLVRNRHIQTLQPCLSANGDLSTLYLFYPSDNGEIYIYRVMDGKLMKRLQRRGNSSTVRTACVIARGRGAVEYYSGALDGTIATWSPGITMAGEGQQTVGDYWGDLEDILGS
jgi:DNA excision repair protein ERCC-8